jgi:hypothetical protein
MRRHLLGTLTLGGLIVCVTMAASQPPGGDGKGSGKRGDKPFGPPRFQLGKVLPPFVADELDLTKDQRGEISKLEAEVKARLEMILNDEQKKKIQTLRPRGPGGPGGSPRDGDKPGAGDKPQKQEPTSAAIQWFATWESGLREAQRTGKPILLVSAAPHCAGVSGIW